jgi:glycosyltransferase involved in cell wall biosynthesis
MRIAINLIPFRSIEGPETFRKNIISNLLKFKSDEEFFILCSENLPELSNFSGATIIKIENLTTKYRKALYQQFNIYPLLRKYKIDILFSPIPTAPVFYKNKIVVIHDCAYDRFTEETKNILSKIYVRVMIYGAKFFGKKIITVSNFSKRELMELYKINPKKIEVIYEGVPELPKVSERFIQKILAKFTINKPYFLYMGYWRPRKNLLGLIKAFKLLKEKGFDYLLVIGGRKDKKVLDLEKEIKNNRLEGKVILTDTLSREEVSALYRKAIALTFPSFYEGFGLPILEAQSLGVPVLTSNTSSLPEIAGEGALYVDPYNVEEIAKGMERIAFNENLRRELIKKGFENVKRFSWEKAAQRLLEIFREICENRD